MGPYFHSVPKRKQTKLGKIQRQIDRCNGKSGCDSKCNKDFQRRCELLRKHADRRDGCRKNNLPYEYW